jgi:hypothetical protein
MLVALVSDTHGNQGAMQRLAGMLKEMKIATILHLGDDYRDLGFLQAQGFEVIGVPGVFCPEYASSRIPNRLILELGGVRLLLTHTETRHRHDRPEDPDPQDAAWEVDLVLYGHTHVPALEKRESGWWLNPGHLKSPVDRGAPATFALLDVAPREIWVEIRRLADGIPILEKSFPLNREADSESPTPVTRGGLSRP